MKYSLAFDVYGTIIDTSGVFDSLEQLIGEKAKQFMDTWKNKQLEYSFRRGLMNKYIDFSVCTENALEFCCLALKMDLSIRQKIELIEEYSFLPTFSDVKTGLQKLKESGHRLFALSNSSKRSISELLTSVKIIDNFDGIVGIEDVEVFKPSPLVYKNFIEKTNSSKLDSWLISSNPFDVIGAISYGMRSVWMQRSTDSIFDPWGIEPTITVNGLTDLSLKL